LEAKALNLPANSKLKKSQSLKNLEIFSQILTLHPIVSSSMIRSSFLKSNNLFRDIFLEGLLKNMELKDMKIMGNPSQGLVFL